MQEYFDSTNLHEDWENKTWSHKALLMGPTNGPPTEAEDWTWACGPQFGSKTQSLRKALFQGNGMSIGNASTLIVASDQEQEL